MHIHKCPSAGIKCNYCKKIGHYAICCFKNNAALKSLSVANHDLFMGSLFCNENETYVNLLAWEIAVQVNNKRVLCILDTGAQTNIMSINTFRQLILPDSSIRSTNTRILTFGKAPLTVQGEVDLQCVINGNKAVLIKFHIVQINCKTILALKSCTELKLIKRVHNVTFVTVAEKADKKLVYKNKSMSSESNKNCNVFVK